MHEFAGKDQLPAGTPKLVSHAETSLEATQHAFTQVCR